MQKAHTNNGTLKIPGNIISLAATKPVRVEKIASQEMPINSLTINHFPCRKITMQPLQQSQTNSSNIPTHKPSNNFQQTLPRYNPPPQHINNNPARRIQQRGRYSTGTATSLIPPPGSFLSQQTPLASPALSTTSTAISVQDTQQKSHIPFPSRLPTQQDMLKFQVRKSETEAATNTNQTVTSNPTNAQIQVSLSHLISHNIRKVMNIGAA